MLSKKDLKRVADIIRDADVPFTSFVCRTTLLNGLMDWFDEENEKFDYDKWLDYLERR